MRAPYRLARSDSGLDLGRRPHPEYRQASIVGHEPNVDIAATSCETSDR